MFEYSTLIPVTELTHGKSHGATKLSLHMHVNVVEIYAREGWIIT